MKRSSATWRALDALASGWSGCSDVGGAVWPGKRRGHVVSSNGGGDYAAQMLLGRMRAAGLARTTSDPGSSRWEMTDEGRRAHRDATD